MALIIGANAAGVLKAGTCVGVLYIETNPKRINSRFCRKYQGRYYCVHNGRLARDFKPGDKTAIVNHWYWSKSLKAPIEERRTLHNVQTIGRITRISPCKSALAPQPAGSTNTLRPNWCGALIERVGKVTDMRNGKYLYYEPVPGQVKCLLRSSQVLPQYRVHYAHYNIYQASSNSKPYIAEQTLVRDHIIGVVSTSRL